MSNEMKTLTVNGVTKEVVDAKARQDLSKLTGSTIPLSGNDVVVSRETIAMAFEGLLESSVTASSDITELKRDVSTLRNDVGKTSNNHEHRLANLEAAANGNLYRVETDSELAAVKVVPADAMPWATLDAIGPDLIDTDFDLETGVLTVANFSPTRIISRGKNLLDTSEGAAVKHYINATKYSSDARWGFEVVPEMTCIVSATGRVVNTTNKLSLYWVDDDDVLHSGSVSTEASNDIADANGPTRSHVLTPGRRYFITPAATSTATLKARMAELKVQVEIGTTATEYEPYSVEQYDLTPVINEYFGGKMHCAFGGIRDTIEVDNGKVYAVKRVDDQGTALEDPVKTEIENGFPTELNVSAGGSLVIENDMGEDRALPWTVSYLIKLTQES